MSDGRRRICVVGAGIAGLAAAWEIRRSAPDVELVVLEADSRPGGVIRTSPFAGRAVDEGADAFLTRTDEATRLCEELGLGADLVAPATNRAFVFLDGALVALPRTHFLGVPLDPDDVEPALLSPTAIAALQADLGREPTPTDGSPNRGDCSVGEFVRGRLGGEVLARLVGPLVGSINAGDCDHLSLQAVAPALAEAAQAHPSLIQALRNRVAAGSGSSGGVFRGLRAGMERLPAALAARLGSALAFSEPALACRPRPESHGEQAGLLVKTPHRSIRCDAVIMAIGAAPTAELVRPWAPRAAELLDRTETASVAIVTLAYDPATLPAARRSGSGSAGTESPHSGDAGSGGGGRADSGEGSGGGVTGSGFLVPAAAGLPITACSWASTKWAHLAASPGGDAARRTGTAGGAPTSGRAERHELPAPDGAGETQLASPSSGQADDHDLAAGARGAAVFRVSLGRHGFDGIVEESDAVLTAAAREGLAATMGLTAEPAAVRISRWPNAFPQYAVGHPARTAEVEQALAAAGVYCAGASYHGIGIPSCIASGRRAAQAALARAT